MTSNVSVIDGVAAGSLQALGSRLAEDLTSGRCASSIRVGVDVVGVGEVAEAVDAHGQHYLARVFTPHELACCRRGEDGGYAPESLAARFAAKEAVLKVLRPVGARPEWRSIEVHQVEGGWCEVQLSGRAAELATRDGITDVAVSLSHEPAVAAAVAAASCRVGNRGKW